MELVEVLEKIVSHSPRLKSGLVISIFSTIRKSPLFQVILLDNRYIFFAPTGALGTSLADVPGCARWQIMIGAKCQVKRWIFPDKVIFQFIGSTFSLDNQSKEAPTALIL